MNIYYYHLSIISVLIFLLSCSSQKMVESKDDISNLVETQQKLIKDNIKDSAIQTELLQIVIDLDKEANKFAQYYAEHRKIATQLIRTQQISRQEIESELTNINNHYETFLKILIQKRKEIRSLTSEDEWIKIMAWDNTYIPK